MVITGFECLPRFRKARGLAVGAARPARREVAREKGELGLRLLRKPLPYSPATKTPLHLMRRYSEIVHSKLCCHPWLALLVQHYLSNTALLVLYIVLSCQGSP